MAVLGTFHEAGVLPPEADPRANQLIRSLIQFQSLFLQSQDPAVQDYVASALTAQKEKREPGILHTFYAQGWTSESLEAMVEYSLQHPIGENLPLKAIQESYNVSQGDWALIQELFLQARQHFEDQSQDVHAVFSEERKGFPGGQTTPSP